MKNHETGICFHCYADRAIHKHDTLQCPVGGIEETGVNKLTGIPKPQGWKEHSFFEDSGIRKLHDAAPDLLKALEDMVNWFKEDNHKIRSYKFSNCYHSINNAEKIIEKLNDN